MRKSAAPLRRRFDDIDPDKVVGWIAVALFFIALEVAGWWS